MFIGWQAIAALAAIFTLISVVTFVGLRVARWSELARAYPRGGLRPEQTVRFVSARVGTVPFKQVFTVGWDAQRLFLSVSPLYLFGLMPEVAIPFSALRTRARVREYGVDREELEVDLGGPFPIALPVSITSRIDARRAAP